MFDWEIIILLGINSVEMSKSWVGRIFSAPQLKREEALFNFIFHV